MQFKGLLMQCVKCNVCTRLDKWYKNTWVYLTWLCVMSNYPLKIIHSSNLVNPFCGLFRHLYMSPDWPVSNMKPSVQKNWTAVAQSCFYSFYVKCDDYNWRKWAHKGNVLELFQGFLEQKIKAKFGSNSSQICNFEK